MSTVNDSKQRKQFLQIYGVIKKNPNVEGNRPIWQQCKSASLEQQNRYSSVRGTPGCVTISGGKNTPPLQ